MPVTLSGHLEHVTFQAEDTGWTVARLLLGDGRQINVVGHLVGVSLGEHLEVEGEWTNHPRFGPQFKLLQYRIIMPATAEGIQKYLGSGAIKGIGPVMAGRIVEHFGERTLDLLDADLHRLLEIEGIGPKRLKLIRSSWKAHHGMRELMVFLQGHGMGPALAVKIFKEYGNRSLDVINKNPYRLATDLYGVGFLTADRLARNLGFDTESVLRAEAGVLYVLQGLGDQGHVCYPEALLLERCRDLLEISSEVIDRAVRGLMDRGMVAVESSGDPPQNYVYLKRLYIAEKGVGNGIRDLMRSGTAIPLTGWDNLIPWVRKRLGFDLADRQKEAVKTALLNKVTVITGGPGTGKTTLIKAIIEIMKRRGQTVLLTAPTGRAAKRLAQSSEQEARTIHRLLEFSPNENSFKRNRDHPLRADVVVVDEASMVDITLMYSLLRALPAEAVLVLVGDVDQLPSVGPGAVLKDIIDSGKVPVIRLDQIFRQADESMIVVNAHRVNAGKWPIMHTEVDKEAPDFYFFERNQEDRLLESLLDLCTVRVRNHFGYDPLNEVQVLTPMNRGAVGVHNLNLELQKALNPGEIELKRGDTGFRTGDKVMQLRNNYDKEVYNGDIGRVLSIAREERALLVEFDGRILPYDFSDLDEISLAYAISIHKSQGSEYPAVIVPLLMQHYMLLQRNLIYTAITRGKSLVIILGQRKALEMAIHNDKTRKRYTLLKDRLVQSSGHERSAFILDPDEPLSDEMFEREPGE